MSEHMAPDLYTIINQSIRPSDDKDEWIEFQKEITIFGDTEEIDHVKMVFYGPASGVNFFVDGIKMELVDAASSILQKRPHSNPF
mmetsp:Transcript_6383/g.9723  ORF Transcript_6383/g.9723 Transcript_6383/m.9723 type:complete len:85 (-) Transcript_6383:137-391(-)